MWLTLDLWLLLTEVSWQQASGFNRAFPIEQFPAISIESFTMEESTPDWEVVKHFQSSMTVKTGPASIAHSPPRLHRFQDMQVHNISSRPYIWAILNGRIDMCTEQWHHEVKEAANSSFQKILSKILLPASIGNCWARAWIYTVLFWSVFSVFNYVLSLIIWLCF